MARNDMNDDGMNMRCRERCSSVGRQRDVEAIVIAAAVATVASRSSGSGSAALLLLLLRLIQLLGWCSRRTIVTCNE